MPLEKDILCTLLDQQSVSRTKAPAEEDKRLSTEGTDPETTIHLNQLSFFFSASQELEGKINLHS